MNYRFVRELLMRNPLALRRLLGHVPNFVRLYIRLLRDPRVPLWLKAVPVAGIAYFVFPGPIPAFLIPWGLIDDLVVLVVTAYVFIRLCPPRVVEEHVRLIDEGG